MAGLFDPELRAESLADVEFTPEGLVDREFISSGEVTQPLSRPIVTRLVVGRRARTRSYLRAPVVVLAAAPVVTQIRVTLARFGRLVVRCQIPLLMKPVVVTAAAGALPPPILRELVSSRAPRTVALLQPWTIRGPPVPVVTATTVVTAPSRPARARSFFVKPSALPPHVTAATVALAPSRKPRARSFFVGPPAILLPTSAQTAVTLAASRRPTTRSLFVRPATVLLPLETATRVTTVAAPRPRTLSLFVRPAGVVSVPPGAPVETEITVAAAVRKTRRPLARSFLRAPVVVAPAGTGGEPVATRARATLVRTPRWKQPTTLLLPPAVVGVPSPRQSTPFAPTPPPPRRSRTRSFLLVPAVTTVVVAAEPVVTSTRTSLVQTRRRPHLSSFLRAPVVVGPGAGQAPNPSQLDVFVSLAPTRRPRVRSLLLPPRALAAALSPSQLDIFVALQTSTRYRSRAPRSLLLPPATVAPEISPSQQEVFHALPAPSRYRSRTRSLLLPPTVVAPPPPPVVTTIFARFATTFKPKARSLFTKLGFTGGTIPDTTGLSPVVCDDLTIAATTCDTVTLATTTDETLTASSSSCDTLTLDVAGDDTLTITPET